jgi:ribosomal protein L7/L12/peptidoglycan hydrolase-like protein with peptidoglycan-binding domain
MNYLSQNLPVSVSNQARVTIHLRRVLGQGAGNTIQNLVKNGGIVRDNLTKAQADRMAVQLRNLGALAEVSPMEKNQVKEGYRLFFIDAGSNKLQVIKEVNTLTRLGLKESKTLVDNLGEVGIYKTRKEAEQVKKVLTAVGAKMSIEKLGGVAPEPDTPLPQPDTDAGNVMPIVSGDLNMKHGMQPVLDGERSYQVVLLHQALEKLGISIDEKEKNEGKAGKDTTQKVRAFQEKNNLKPESNLLADQGTLRLIFSLLKEQNLLEASRSFVVNGETKTETGNAVKNQLLLVFDLNFNGLAHYQKLKNADDKVRISNLSGLKFLGATTSDNCGKFRLDFFDWQYFNATQKIGNIVVFAIGDESSSDAVLGYSFVIQTHKCKDAGIARDIEIIIKQTDHLTEFENISNKLNQFALENKVSTVELWSSPEQLTYTADNLGIEPTRIILFGDSLEMNQKHKSLHAELLYGLGRQEVDLVWPVLFARQDEELLDALLTSEDEFIIQKYPEDIKKAFILTLREKSTKAVLTAKTQDSEYSVSDMLNYATTDGKLQMQYLKALNSCKGFEFATFWEEYLPSREGFRNKPAVIKKLRLTHELSALTNNNTALTIALQRDSKVKSIDDLFDLQKKDWLKLIDKSRVFDDDSFGTDAEKIKDAYATQIVDKLAANYPTKCILNMVKKHRLPIRNKVLEKNLQSFFESTVEFDIAHSNPFDFEGKIKSADGLKPQDVLGEICKIQRVYQLSPKAELIPELMKNNLDSAASISKTPKRTFIRKFSNALAGEENALKLYQKAEFIASRNELIMMLIGDYSFKINPLAAIGKNDRNKAIREIQNRLPNYQDLFGFQSSCECNECRSVFSPAAYFVDLLRFLDKTIPENHSNSILNILETRRPDLVHLPLSCENSHTILPYIDLANEIMEYYVSHESIKDFEGYDTGNTSQAELRASPQNVKPGAYKKLANAKHPFSLPYHQPLDVIRVFCNHLDISRYGLMQSFISQNLNDGEAAHWEIAAESMHLSGEEFSSITGSFLNKEEDSTPVHEFFGFTRRNKLDDLRKVPVFLERTGLIYNELIELLKTEFINPKNQSVEFLEKLISASNIDSREYYGMLKKIERLEAAEENKLNVQLKIFNATYGSDISSATLSDWIKTNLDSSEDIITLYDSDSKCDLAKTSLKTIRNIYSKRESSGISANRWSRFHRFIRLWKKSGWSIRETDLILKAINTAEINAQTILHIEQVLKVKEATKLSVSELSVFWGEISTEGIDPLYKRLFLNKSLSNISGVFKPDIFGQFFTGEEILIDDNKTEILAAFKITESDLDITLAKLFGDTPVMLNLKSLSMIYRHALFAKSLNLKPSELFTLIEIFGDKGGLYSSPKNTADFCQWVAEVKTSGFTIDNLEFVMGNNSAPAALFAEKAKETRKNIQNALIEFDVTHPQNPNFTITPEFLSSQLELLFPTQKVKSFIQMLSGKFPFEEKLDDDVTLEIPETLKNKYSYTLLDDTKVLTINGFMTEDEMNELLNLSEKTEWEDLIKNHYEKAHHKIAEPFLKSLELNDNIISSSEDLLETIYKSFLPYLKRKMSPQFVIHHISILLGLDAEITSLILRDNESDIEELIKLPTLDEDKFSDLTALFKWYEIKTSLDQEKIEYLKTYPLLNEGKFLEEAIKYNRSALFIKQFKLQHFELKHFIKHHADFGEFNLKEVSASAWEKINNYVRLRDSVPQKEATLIDIFETAYQEGSIEAIIGKITGATNWHKQDVKYLIEDYFRFSVEDFSNEMALVSIGRVMQYVARTGLSAVTLAQVGKAATDFDSLDRTALILRNVVRAKYSENEWMEISGRLNNILRENQQSALASYMLTLDSVKNWGATNEDGLFEYLLLDVQMKSCMETSRIVQASASVQMFVNRCLLNLEHDSGISPMDIDEGRWEWIKHYRVWEANRKTFVQAENYLEPEWRNNKSQLFQELESYLTQNDINEQTAEKALGDYVHGLDAISNLDVCGMHQEDGNDGKLKYLHVFARTHSAPYTYYYRTLDEFGRWSAWEEVPVDIRGTEASAGNPDNSGVQLAPVVWKNRLFLFWPEFTRVSRESSAMSGGKSIEETSKESVNALKAEEVLEVKLAWSEYVDGKWMPKQINNVHNLSHKMYPRLERDYGFYINEYNDALYIYLLSLRGITSRNGTKNAGFNGACFIFEDINKKMNLGRRGFILGERNIGSFNYQFDFNAKLTDGKLQFEGNTYLITKTIHKLLTTNQNRYKISNQSPFIFSSLKYSYFVKPHKKSWFDQQRLPVYAKQLSFSDLNLGNIPENWVNPSERGIIDISTSISDGTYSLNNRRRSELFNNIPLADELYVFNRDRLLQSTYSLEFYTFYHPFSGEYIRRINQKYGIKKLFESDIVIPSDQGRTFTNSFNPDFSFGRVIEAKNKDRTYYKENVCFDPYGAYSMYNWELFFHAPLYIATRLSKNGRYREAMQWFHFIFDPTTSENPSNESDTARFWKCLPFRKTASEIITDWFHELSKSKNSEMNKIVEEWLENPFDPHRVAFNRPILYMQNTVLKYVENIIAWADSLFRRDTMESVNEALQMYVLANHILGPRPQTIPKRGNTETQTFHNLRKQFDSLGNALVPFENIFPFSSESIDNSSGTEVSSLLGTGTSLYFCIPRNQKILEYWDTVEDRLFKIRNCQNIDGIERSLALFAPPIDPALLVQAAARGVSIGDILADLNSPTPLYRFNYLLQKANEFCNDVKALGNSLLAALEKKDAEELNLLRSSHENQMLEMMTAIRERSILEARSNKEGLLKSRETAVSRLNHYIGLLGVDDITVPPPPDLQSNLTLSTQLPDDTNIMEIESGVDDSLSESGEGGVKLIPKEQLEIEKLDDAHLRQRIAQGSEALAAIANILPGISGDAKPLGVGVGTFFGGLGAALSATGRISSYYSSIKTYEATEAAKMASYIRRTQDWTFQANMAIRELIQLDKQITSTDIRIQIAHQELVNHKKQMAHAKEMEEYLKGKFTNKELYHWMKDQIYTVYKQAYNLAYDMAKKAEKACKNELGLETDSFIKYGYWESSKQGLVAGDKLQLALRQLEKFYIEHNRREYELSKHISLNMLDPLALIQLREKGNCDFEIPEVLYDMDHPGHYFRRVKSVSISLPCIAGPHTSVSAKLSLVKNKYRKNTNIHDNYPEDLDNDNRFMYNIGSIQSIAASNAQNDSGVFELNFRDERYLPFEYAGAISNWRLELPTQVRQFNYDTISDVVVHIKYTAREGGSVLKEQANKAMGEQLNSIKQGLEKEGLHIAINMKHELPNEWHLLKQKGEVDLIIDKSTLPYFVKSIENIEISKVMFLARTKEDSDGRHSIKAISKFF